MTTFQVEADAGAGWTRVASADNETAARELVKAFRGASTVRYRIARLDVTLTVLDEHEDGTAAP